MELLGNHAVIGLGFGDEGKGHVVNWLCTRAHNPTVERFCGGPQAAHHVVLADGTDHVFSHFGSGTLLGAATHWSRYCSMNPVALMNELDDLKKKGYDPILYIHNHCPVITPFEITWNQARERETEHGSCGVGIFATVRREARNYHLWFEDLFHPTVLKLKVAQLREYYKDYGSVSMVDFYAACEEVVRAEKIDGTSYDTPVGRTTIFEGSQGLMLDQNYGFFPHVTPSNTGTANVRSLTGSSPTVWLVTRAYQTRHGAGPMSMHVVHGIKDNPHERNRDDGPQGEFRKTLLDLDMLRYAVSKDPGIHDPKLVVTCMDLLDGHYRLIDGGRVYTYTNESQFLTKIAHTVGAAELYASYGPTAEDIKKIN
jgi:adenylosuccinate synthase